uniref:Uncharacterized protein n=1 Tax=Clastoptera arizonana TaxID=38151 RepID=A0A1B6CV56_9HEMI
MEKDHIIGWIFLSVHMKGLFKENKRFGPGVFTYADGSQDVGHWCGGKLVRLAIIVGEIPSIATTHNAQMKLLNFRKLVDIKDEVEYQKYILEKMECDKIILDQYHLLYSDSIKNPKSLLFNKPFFDGHFFGVFNSKEDSDSNIFVKEFTDVKDYIDLEPDSLKISGKLNSSKKVEEPILVRAWNNGNLAIDILRHCFRHRKFEKKLWFTNAHIIRRKRNHFRDAGKLELACKQFLKACLSNDISTIKKIVKEYNLDIDISDAAGNSAFHFAMITDDCNMIEKLIDLEANINQCNDEGLTPLSLSLLKYLGTKHEISDWSEAFLPNEETDKKENGGHIKQKYVFDLSFSHFKAVADEKEGVNKKQKKGGKNKLTKNKVAKEGKKTKLSKSDPVQNQQDDEQELKKGRLNNIKKTCVTLLNNGADLNEISVPMPGMFLVLYCENFDFLKAALSCKGNINSKLPEELGNLSMLHTVCLLPYSNETLEMVKIILIEGADTNAKTTVNYALPFCGPLGLPDTILEEIDCGFTALQVLCMRPDGEYIDGKEILIEIVSLLIKVTHMKELFQGHSPLSMAIASGNISIVKTLLQSNIILPDQILGHQVGTALTVLLDPVRLKFVPLELLIQMMSCLIDAGANPLLIVNINSFRGTSLQYAHYNLENMKAQISTLSKKKKEKQLKNEEIKKYTIIVDHLNRKI